MQLMGGSPETNLELALVNRKKKKKKNNVFALMEYNVRLLRFFFF